jgi:protoporphyrinogen oxidase
MATKKWSAEVTEHSDAMDLEQDIFKSGDPDKIAHSLKCSAEQSNRRKSAPFRSAMSMITFYENRAGKNLEHKDKEVLEKAKDKLRELFGKEKKD